LSYVCALQALSRCALRDCALSMINVLKPYVRSGICVMVHEDIEFTIVTAIASVFFLVRFLGDEHYFRWVELLVFTNEVVVCGELREEVAHGAVPRL